MSNSLIKTLTGLKGNPRACVYTEPLWGLSLNLCIPYASVYMLAIGLNDLEESRGKSIFSLAAGYGGDCPLRLDRRHTFRYFADPSLCP